MDKYRRRPPMEGFSRPGSLGGEAHDSDDSVEGHIMDDDRTQDSGSSFFKRADDDDTEGHKKFPRADDDTEGHLGGLRRADDDEDTEGHIGLRRSADDDDDTEGHVGLRRSVDDEDTEGHAKIR